MALHTLHDPQKAVYCCRRANANDAVIIMDEAAWSLASIANLEWPCPLYVYADDLSITGAKVTNSVTVATVDDWLQLTVDHPQHIAW